MTNYEQIVQKDVQGLAEVCAYLVDSCGSCPIRYLCDHLDCATCEETWVVWLEREHDDHEPLF